MDAATARVTWTGIDPDRTGAGGAISRRCGLALVGAVVVAGAVGMLGVRTASQAVRSDGLRLSVDYPRVARPGLDVVFVITVEGDQPLVGPVDIGLDPLYLRRFEAQAIQPEPDAQSFSDGQVVWSFAPGVGTRRLRVEVDHYVQPGSQIGYDGVVTVHTGDNRSASVVTPMTLAP